MYTLSIFFLFFIRFLPYILSSPLSLLPSFLHIIVVVTIRTVASEWLTLVGVNEIWYTERASAHRRSGGATSCALYKGDTIEACFS